jgi:nicotinate-nucleotide adenylyltransferase
MARIGVLGGTFDPIHNGHLFVAEDARIRLRLDHLLVIPNAIPPHKKLYDVTPAHHRLMMVALGLSAEGHLEASDIEVARGGRSFTVDTIRLLRTRFPDADLVFITGADAIAEIGTWREPEEVARLCSLVAVSRPGFELGDLQRLVPPSILPRLDLHTVPAIGISSTMIRERVAAGLPIVGLTPDRVARYIAGHGLYRA